MSCLATQSQTVFFNLTHNMETYSYWLLIWKYMGWIDVVFVIAFAVGVFLGLNRGFGKMLRRVSEVLVAQVVVLEYYQALAQAVHVRIPIPIPLLEIFMFAALAIGSILAILFLFQVLSAIVFIEATPFVRNILGGIIGGVYFVLLLGLLSSFLLMFPSPWMHDSFHKSALSGPFLAELTPQVHGWAKSFILERLSAP